MFFPTSMSSLYILYGFYVFSGVSCFSQILTNFVYKILFVVNYSFTWISPFFQVFNLILSDVVGDPLDIIASGPTVIDTSTSSDALDIIHRYLSPQQVDYVWLFINKF